MFRPGGNPNHNCVVYSKYYYINSYNQYKSMNSLICPEEAKYLVKSEKYCIYDCSKEKKYKYLYDGNCIESCPEGTTNIDNICKEDPSKVYVGKNALIVEDEDYSSLKVVQTKAKIYVSGFSYTQNHISLYENNEMTIGFYENPEALKEVSLDIPKIDFQNCSKKVKDNYNIEGNLLTSVVNIKDKQKHETSYSFFHPVSGQKLERAENICQNDTIILKENLTSLLNINSTSFKLQMSLTEQGINIFDLNDPFYKDICYDFDNPFERDIALRDRVREAYPNATLCEEGCRNSGINLGDMTATCDCTFHDITQSNIIKENAILDSMVGEIFNIIDDSNILVVKCYKYIIKYFMRSYGGIITAIIIALNLILTLIFFCCQFRKISKYAIYLTKKYLKFLELYFYKYRASPPKRKSKIIEIKNKPSFKNQGSAEKLKEDINNQNQVTEYKETTESINEWKKLKHFFKEYLATSPDDMEFDDAVKKDNRGFCSYFYENLKEKVLEENQKN